MKKIYVSPEAIVIEVKHEELLVASPGFVDGEVGVGEAVERLDAEGVFEGLSVWE